MARKTQFKRDLEVAGYMGETVEFYRIVLEAFDTFTPTYATDEQLKRHPKDALRFCDTVRDRLHLPELPDALILGGLENGRKNPAKIEQYVS